MAGEDPSQSYSSEHIRDSASGSMHGTPGSIHDRVHDLTLRALRSRRFNRSEIRDVVRAMTEGITLGAAQSRADIRLALADAFRGLDEAMRKSTEAGHSALRELVAAGRSFSDSDLKRALADMRRLEEDFLTTVEQVAESANERVRPELRELISRARRSGTATGRQLTAMMGDFAQRFSSASIDVALGGLETASEFSARFAQVAGGVLAGFADALGEQRTQRRDAASTGAKPDSRTRGIS